MLPETLKELREERGMKQAQIAIILGVKQNTYSNWENGTRNPSVNLLKRLADGMGMVLKIEFVPKQKA